MANRKRNRAFSNFGDGTQVYDVCFEVDKLDYLSKTEGKDSEKYKSQHKKAVKLVDNYNSENSQGSLSLSKCRTIIHGPHHEEGLVFFNSGKTTSSNRDSLKSE